MPHSQTSYWPTGAGHEGQVARVTTTSRRPAPFRLQGYGRLLLETPVAPLWELTLREGEVFSRRTTPHSGAVASLGKVTGDRTVLYKCAFPRRGGPPAFSPAGEDASLKRLAPPAPAPPDLNPHLLAYSTVSPATNTSSVYVVDTSRGSIVYETTHRDVDVRSPVEILLVENWLVYTFKSRVGPLPAAQQLVSVELYESNEGKSKLKRCVVLEPPVLIQQRPDLCPCLCSSAPSSRPPRPTTPSRRSRAPTCSPAASARSA